MLALLTWVCQMILIVEIMIQLIYGEKAHFDDMLNTGAIIFVRFICATILHLSLIEEVNSSLMNMKYVLNHRYNFERP